MSKIIETCPNRSSFSWLESCMENLKRKQQIMCIICKNDNWNWKSCWVLNMNILVSFFLEIASTWARNQKTRVFKSTWPPTQFPASFQCLFFLTSPKKEFLLLVTKVVQSVGVRRLSSISCHLTAITFETPARRMLVVWKLVFTLE